MQISRRRRVGAAAAALCALAVNADAQCASARNVATGPLILMVDNAGNDLNDGITAPKQHICAAILAIYTTWDLANNPAIVQPTSGQTFDETGQPCAFGGQIVGNNVITIQPAGSTHFTWKNPNTCLQWGDGAEFIVNHATMNCDLNNAVGQAAFYEHQYAVGDFNDITYVGGGNNDALIHVDGEGRFTFSGPLQIVGRAHEIIGGDTTMHGTFSSSVTFAANSMAPSGAFVDRLYRLNGTSELNIGASFTTAGLYSMGQSIVTGRSVLNENGVSVLGGVAPDPNGLVCAAGGC